MGEVYLARITRGKAFQKIVAVKKMLPQLSNNPDFMRQFENEARFAARLHHANIVSVYDYGTAVDSAFLAMEYVDGTDLVAIIDSLRAKGRTIPLIDALSVAASTAAGLDYVHRLKDASGEPLALVHQDVSPQNVLISSEGEVKIADFGLARAMKKANQPLEGKLIGKLAYMAPEIFERKPVDLRADIFALGCLLYESLTGEYALGNYAHNTNLADRVAAVERSMIEIENYAPKETADIVRKCLKRDPGERYASAKDAYEDMRVEIAKLEASGEKADLPALVLECGNYRKEARVFLSPDRTIAASRPIAEGKTMAADAPIKPPLTGEAEPADEKADKTPRFSIASETAKPKRRKTLLLAALFVVLLAAAAAFWLFALPAGTLVVNDVEPGSVIIVDGARISSQGVRAEIPVYGRGKEHKLVVEKNYRKPFEFSFNFEKDDVVKVSPSLEKLLGSISLSSNPKGAAVKLNGRLVGGAPIEIADAPLGEKLNLRLEMDGYVPYESAIILTDEKKIEINHVFESLTVGAQIETEPADCAVFFNGARLKGKQPFTIDNLNPGRQYAVEIFAKGKLPQRLLFVPKRGEKNLFKASLEPLAFKVNIEKKEGFSYILNGSPAPATIGLKPGDWPILAVYDEKKNSLVLRFKINETAEASGKTSQTVVFTINAKPWAKIYVDNAPEQTTPIASISLKSGQHKIGFSFGGSEIKRYLNISF